MEYGQILSVLLVIAGLLVITTPIVVYLSVKFGVLAWHNGQQRSKELFNLRNGVVTKPFSKEVKRENHNG